MKAAESIRSSHIEQAQLSQAYRWLAACSDEHTRMNLDELLRPAAKIFLSATPVTTGVAGVCKIRNLHIQSVDASMCASAGRLRLIASAIEVAPMKTANPADVDILFESVKDGLPLISEVRITLGTKEVTSGTPHLLPYYRILALKHRWHAMVEAPNKEPQAFREITTQNFGMDWQTGRVTSFRELEQWLTHSASSVSAARHDIEAFEWQPVKDGVYHANFDFQWSGFSLANEPMQARSKHSWIIIEDFANRFPRLERMDVELTIPFHKVNRDLHDEPER